MLRDFLRVLQDLKRSGSQPRRLQMIATDTWDISDDLGVYNVSDFLEVQTSYILSLYVYNLMV